MYAAEDIKSNTKGTIYAKKGDKLHVINDSNHPLILCCKPGNDGFYCNISRLTETDPGAIILQSQESKDAEKQLRAGLKRMCRTSSYQFRILFNRVYFGKVNKFPVGIDRETWLNVARIVWSESPLAGTEILDEIKANQ